MKKQHVIDLINIQNVYSALSDTSEKQELLKLRSNFQDLLEQIYDYDYYEMNLIDDIATDVARLQTKPEITQILDCLIALGIDVE